MCVSFAVFVRDDKRSQLFARFRKGSIDGALVFSRCLCGVPVQFSIGAVYCHRDALQICNFYDPSARHTNDCASLDDNSYFYFA